MTRIQMIKLIAPILYRWRCGSRRQCEEIAGEIVNEIKLGGIANEVRPITSL